MFDDRQRVDFKRLGHLPVTGGIDDSLVRHALREVEAAVPEQWDDEVALARRPDREDVLPIVDDPDPFEELEAELTDAVDELIGTAVDPDATTMQVSVGYPGRHRERDPGAPQLTELSGELPGYDPDDPTAEPDYVVATATVYLDRVLPQGGGLTVWSGSHWNAGEFFNTHPFQSGHGGIWAIEQDEGRGHLSFAPQTKRSDQFDGFEIHGEAGTLILTHGKLERTYAPNLTPYPRVAATATFQLPDAETIKEEAAMEIWHHWPALQGIDVGYRASYADGAHRITE